MSIDFSFGLRLTLNRAPGANGVRTLSGVDTVNRNWQFKLVDSLEKVFPDEEPPEMPSRAMSAFLGERLSLQVAFRPPDGLEKLDNDVAIVVESSDDDAVATSIASVDLVPCELVAHPGYGSAYLRGAPGLYPDILRPVHDGVVDPIAGAWRAVWIDVSINAVSPTGSAVVQIRCRHARTGESLFAATVKVAVIAAELPPLDIVNTQWFHADGLAEYYGFDVYSTEHWASIESFVRSAVRMEVNSMLVPVWTPPVDTAVGARRRNVQLVTIARRHHRYEFDFTKVGQWLDICERCGVRSIEVPHFFTQWGARAAPSIVVEVDGGEREMFGWSTAAESADYREFLEEFVPALRGFLESRWNPAEIFYHISDEPSAEDAEAYARARSVVTRLLSGCTIIDALSSIELFGSGLVEKPVIATDSVEPFQRAGIERLWVYFCVAQHRGVANRFIGMQSGSLRLFGHQLFAADAGGFLHWGFNFYYSALAERFVDPFRDASGGGTFLAGDPFIVYPGEHGEPWESIRHRISAQAMYDHRAYQFVRDRIGRDDTVSLIEADGALTFAAVESPADRVRQGRRRIDEVARGLVEGTWQVHTFER